MPRNILLKPVWLIKLTRYEFWHAYFFYAPFVVYWVYLSLKAKDFNFFTHLNPCMMMGGAVGCNKIGPLEQIAKKYLPITKLVERNAGLCAVLDVMEKTHLTYPIFIKPNNGERGKGVERIENENQLSNYLSRTKDDMIIQECVEGHNELGVFFYRDPITNKVELTSIVIKEFLHIKGDGISTIRQLLKQNLRSRLRIDYLCIKYADELDLILPEQETLYLEPVGNHCLGTEFKNGNHLINEELRVIVNDICASIPSFEYGRFDLKYESLELLLKGQGIKILEVNGVGAEPAHIYDESYSLWNAYKDVKKHIDIMFGIYNVKYKNQPKSLKFKDFSSRIRQHVKLVGH